MKARFTRALVLLGAFLCLVGISFAQTGTSSVRGTVTDPQGRVVPSAFVTLTSTGTGIVRTQKTGPVGNFSFDLFLRVITGSKSKLPGSKNRYWRTFTLWW